LGKISYPLYLWHWPVLVLPIAFFARELSLAERVSALLLTVILADLTTRYVEEPIRIMQFSVRQVVNSTVIAMALAILIGFGIAKSTTSSILVDGKQITLASIESRPSPYDDGCHLNYQQSVSPLCEFGKLTGRKTVVLYGDSHAVQWFPALEKLALEKGFKLITLTKSACPSIDVVRESVGAFKMSNCAAWRENAIKRITAAKPDLIILSSFEHFIPSGDPKTVKQWWAEGSERTYQTLKPLTSKLIYLRDTPLPDRNIPSCLTSTSADKCLAGSKVGLPQVANFEIIDPAEWLCDGQCKAIVRGNVAYRDASHISVATSLELSDSLWEALIAKGFKL
jgi:hypothetical protein